MADTAAIRRTVLEAARRRERAAEMRRAVLGMNVGRLARVCTFRPDPPISR